MDRCIQRAHMHGERCLTLCDHARDLRTKERRFNKLAVHNNDPQDVNG